MSFSVEFVAVGSEAERLVNQEYLPSEVKLFLLQGLRAFSSDSLVRVKAVGHLYNRDYQRSSADIFVEGVSLRKSDETTRNEARLDAAMERMREGKRA